MSGFTQLDVSPDIEQDPWTELADPQLRRRLRRGTLTKVGLLRNGTQSGRATVSLLAYLDDGTPVLLETTLRLWRVANAALMATPIVAEEPLDD